jgi:hypothetical protein
MAETDTQTAAEAQAQTQTQTGETGSFAALLQQEFKPRTDRAREAVESAVSTLAAQALETGSVVLSYDRHFLLVPGLRVWPALTAADGRRGQRRQPGGAGGLGDQQLGGGDHAGRNEQHIQVVSGFCVHGFFYTINQLIFQVN